MNNTYEYRPGLMDLCDPIVIKGEAIKPGTHVTVSRKLRPPMFPSCFVVIVDKAGNVNHAFKQALHKIEKYDSGSTQSP